MTPEKSFDPDTLAVLLYEELRALAHSKMAQERRDHTLQATAVVNEAYLRLMEQTRTAWKDRDHFFAVAATMIRRILVDHARARGAAKRGGAGKARVTLSLATGEWSGDQMLDVIELDEALQRLAALNERRASVVELRFFGGLTIEQTARALDVSTTTVDGDWAVARAWLHRELGGAPDG